MSLPEKKQEYSLYLDESGQFLKHSTDPKERESAAPQDFPDQIAGFFAPRSKTIAAEASEIMKKACSKARLPYDGKSHAKYLGVAYINLLLPPLLEELKKRNWQPVRLVNKETVVYGPRISTYTNMVAELVLRILQSKAKEVDDHVYINLIGAIVTLDEKIVLPSGKEHARIIEIEEYLQTISDYLNWAANQRNILREQLRWGISKINLKDAVKTPELQICDLLSNASHKNYSKCTPDNAKLLKIAFGDFDQTIETKDLLAELDRYIERQEFGEAILRLARVFCLGSETSYFRNAAALRLENAVNRLCQIGVRGRNSHLLFVTARLEQLIGERREANLGATFTHWLQSAVIASLRRYLQVTQSDSTIDWFEYVVARWQMTAANHRGIFTESDRALTIMKRLQPSLAKRSECYPILMEGIITQAVHEMDTFNFDAATKNLQWISSSLSSQADALKDLMPDDFEVAPHYELKARALGTLALNLILSRPKSDADWETARRVSNEAIYEFVDLDDKSRQYQIRCHLETNAGNFSEARRYLYMSFEPALDSTNVSHEMLAQAFNKTGEARGFTFQFSLAHWLRIGFAAVLNGDRIEAEKFVHCFRRSKVADSEWCKGERSTFPAHLILRFLSVIQASQGDIGSAMNTLQRLQKVINDGSFSFIMKAIEVATFAEVAALVPPFSPEFDVLLGDQVSKCQDEPGSGIKQILMHVLQNKNINTFPFLARKFGDWQESVGRLIEGDLSEEDVRDVLLGIGHDVCH